MDIDAERKKWDEIYSKAALKEEEPFIESFNKELLSTLLELIPGGGDTLEAGSGAGWHSLALARSGKFSTTLMDFSKQALELTAANQQC